MIFPTKTRFVFSAFRISVRIWFRPNKLHSIRNFTNLLMNTILDFILSSQATSSIHDSLRWRYGSGVSPVGSRRATARGFLDLTEYFFWQKNNRKTREEHKGLTNLCRYMTYDICCYNVTIWIVGFLAMSQVATLSQMRDSWSFSKCAWANVWPVNELLSFSSSTRWYPSLGKVWCNFWFVRAVRRYMSLKIM